MAGFKAQRDASRCPRRRVSVRAKAVSVLRLRLVKAGAQEGA